MTVPKGLYIFGFGGHARSVGDVALAVGIARLLFIDAAVRPGEGFGGHSALPALPATVEPDWSAFPALGDNGQRRASYSSIGLPKATLIAPTASIGFGADIADAVLVANQAHVGPLVVIETGVIINSGAVVDHESRVGAFSHVSVNATVAGRCRIGVNVFIGAGATVIDGISIVGDVTVGAGATVTRDITEPGVYVGTPARLIRP